MRGGQLWRTEIRKTNQNQPKQSSKCMIVINVWLFLRLAKIRERKRAAIRSRQRSLGSPAVLAEAAGGSSRQCKDRFFFLKVVLVCLFVHFTVFQ